MKRLKTKVCAKCRKRKLRKHFYPYRRFKSGLQSFCIECGKKYNAKRRQQKEKECKARARRDWLWSQYGLTEYDYKQILQHQKYRCGICRIKLHCPQVDHCHKTGRIRGLLCQGCNTALGGFKDRIRILRQAITYLVAA